MKKNKKMLVNNIKKNLVIHLNMVTLYNKIKNNFNIRKLVNKQKGIKSISTPNKKFEKILEKNFITLKINNFRTSIIHNKKEKNIKII